MNLPEIEVWVWVSLLNTELWAKDFRNLGINCGFWLTTLWFFPEKFNNFSEIVQNLVLWLEFLMLIYLSLQTFLQFHFLKIYFLVKPYAWVKSMNSRSTFETIGLWMWSFWRIINLQWKIIQCIKVMFYTYFLQYFFNFTTPPLDYKEVATLTQSVIWQMTRHNLRFLRERRGWCKLIFIWKHLFCRKTNPGSCLPWLEKFCPCLSTSLRRTWWRNACNTQTGMNVPSS